MTRHGEQGLASKTLGFYAEDEMNGACSTLTMHTLGRLRDAAKDYSVVKTRLQSDRAYCDRPELEAVSTQPVSVTTQMRSGVRFCFALEKLDNSTKIQEDHSQSLGVLLPDHDLFIPIVNFDINNPKQGRCHEVEFLDGAVGGDLPDKLIFASDEARTYLPQTKFVLAANGIKEISSKVAESEGTYLDRALALQELVQTLCIDSTVHRVLGYDSDRKYHQHERLIRAVGQLAGRNVVSPIEQSAVGSAEVPVQNTILVERFKQDRTKRRWSNRRRKNSDSIQLKASTRSCDTARQVWSDPRQVPEFQIQIDQLGRFSGPGNTDDIISFYADIIKPQRNIDELIPTDEIKKARGGLMRVLGLDFTVLRKGLLHKLLMDDNFGLDDLDQAAIKRLREEHRPVSGFAISNKEYIVGEACQIAQANAGIKLSETAEDRPPIVGAIVPDPTLPDPFILGE